MIKKIVCGLAALLLIGAGLAWYKFLKGKTAFEGRSKMFYIYTAKANRAAILNDLKRDSILSSTGDFKWLAGQMKYWQKIKPGRYKIEKGSSVLQLVRQLRNGQQASVNLVINKLRLPEDLAKLVGKNFECDSAEVMKALLAEQKDTSKAIPGASVYKIIPDTYTFFWNTPVEKIMAKLHAGYDAWWQKDNRMAKAKQRGYSPEQLMTVASIVEEETNKKEDRGKVASVYFNRLQRGMPLQADPTIRFALKNFAMNRIYYNQLNVASPYNTYRNAGLPPSPICTPSTVTIDAVLNAPQTEYLFFVANADLLGGSTFTTNLSDHSKAAKLYQDSLTEWMKRKALKQNAAAGK